MPTVCLLFNSATAVGDCIFTQFSYLLNIQRKIWDDGEPLKAVREKQEQWPDAGIDAGLFVADPEKQNSDLKAFKTTSTHSRAMRVPAMPRTAQEQSAYYTHRGGKYLMGILDPANPRYEEALAARQKEERSRRTDTSLRNVRHNTLDIDEFGAGMDNDEWREDIDTFEINTFSPRMVVPNKHHEIEYAAMAAEFVQNVGQQNDVAGTTNSSAHLSSNQKRISVFGLGARGAALLLRPSAGEEQPLLSVEGVQYSATTTTANVTISEEPEEEPEDEEEDEQEDERYRRKSAPVMLPSAILAKSLQRNESKVQHEEELDVTHAHFSDSHHFDLTDKQRKVLQQEMHHKKHPIGRLDKENKQLLALGAAGVVSEAYRSAKIAQRKSISEKAHILNMGTGVKTGTVTTSSLLSALVSARNLRVMTGEGVQPLSEPPIGGDEALYAPVRPADAPPSRRRGSQ